MSFVPHSHGPILKSDPLFACTTGISHHISAASSIHSFETIGSQHSHSVISSDDDIPRSVRGAAPEQRRLIRKRQNSESAKRCRLRKKLKVARTAEVMQLQTRKVHRLEALVQYLANRLYEAQTMIDHISAARAAATQTDATHGIKMGRSEVWQMQKNALVNEASEQGAAMQVQQLQPVLGEAYSADGVPLAFKAEDMEGISWS